MDWALWMKSWDHQQEGYMTLREQRFDVILDAVEEVLRSKAPRVLDLASGPGSLAARVLDRFPEANVVSLDHDPVLQLLGREVHGSRDGHLHWVLGDLTGDDWVAEVDVHGPFDAVVSTTALHWLAAPSLARCFALVAGLVAPGGLFVNGDHISEVGTAPRLRSLQESLRVLPRDGRQEYRPWWADLEAAALSEPALMTAFEERARRNAGHPQAQESPAIDFHEAALRTAGFAEVGTVWQEADNRVIVALK